MTALPAFLKTWNHTGINQRITYSSLNDTMATFLFGIKNYLVATIGATVVYACDGTTGPATSADHTDRWVTKANCVTRGANAASAQSFCVLTFAGVHLLLAYQGASDDVARLAFSQGSLYIPAGTATNQPTATDETKIVETTSLVNATTSADRVYHILATSDKTVFRCWLYRQGSLIAGFGLEQVVSTLISHTWNPPVVGWSTNGSTWNNVVAGSGCSMGASGTAGSLGSAGARVDSSNILVGGGGESYNGAAVFGVPAPELNAGAPVVVLSFASTTTSFNGKLGNRYDAFYAWCTGALQGEPFDDGVANTRVMALGTMLQPWPIASGCVLS